MIGLGLGLGLTPGFAGSSAPTAPVSAGLVGWYKGDAGFTAGGAWLDQSGAGNNLAAQGSGFVTSGTLNGHTVVAQGAAGGWLLGNPFALGAAGAITIGGVFLATGTGTKVAMVDYTDAVFDGHALGYDGASAPIKPFCRTNVANSADGTTDISAAWHRMVLTDINGGNQFLYVDNVQEATQASAGAIANNLQLRLGISASFKLAELLVYQGVVSSGNRALNDSYLKTKFGLP